MTDQQAAFTYLNKKKRWNVGMIQVLQRGTAELLCVNDHGVYLRDTVSDAYMMSVDDIQMGMAWLHKFEDRSYSLMQLCNREIAECAKQKYGFGTVLECFQAVYEGEESLPFAGADTVFGERKTFQRQQDAGRKTIKQSQYTEQLEIREPDAETMQLIQSSYDKLSEEELNQIHRLHNLYAGYLDGDCVGFIGSHLEGSMGLLEVFPKYRRRGYALELERFMIAHMLRQGLLAFAQIETWNAASLELQKKLGMRISKEKIYWLF